MIKTYYDYIQDCQADKREWLKEFKDLKKNFTSEQMYRYFKIKNVVKSLIDTHVWDSGQLMMAYFVKRYIYGN